MKYLILLAAFLCSSPLLADSTFLSGLDFARVYEEKGDLQYTQIHKNGISVTDFMTKLTNDRSSLGEKVALIESLSSYYEWADHPKGNFGLYQKKYFDHLKKTDNKIMSFDNESVDPETRLLWVLMNDYDTSSPNVKAYRHLAEKMPQSLTAQTISVTAYAYDILYNDLNNFKTIQDLKQNYLKPYFENLRNFNADVPVEVKELAVDSILPYTLDCQGRLKCLVDTSSEEHMISGLNDLSDTIKQNIRSGIKINDFYAANWVNSREEALAWINLQEKQVDKMTASDLQKAEIRYFFINTLYELMHNIDYLSIRLYESSFIDELKKSKSKCKEDAICASETYVKKIGSDLAQKGISKKEVELLHSAKNKYKIAAENVSQDLGIASAVAAAGSGGGFQYQFESTENALFYLMFYFHLNPEKIGEMYDLK